MNLNQKFEYKVGHALQLLLVALSQNLNLKTFLLVNPKSFETKSQFLIWCVSYLQASLIDSGNH